MANDVFKYKVKLRQKARKLYPYDVGMQQKFIDGVLTKKNMKDDNPKESRQMVAQAFKIHG